jgi:hypothetical protein
MDMDMKFGTNAHTHTYTHVYTRVASKVVPPIHFHGNYNRYKEHSYALKHSASYTVVIR